MRMSDFIKKDNQPPQKTEKDPEEKKQAQPVSTPVQDQKPEVKKEVPAQAQQAHDQNSDFEKIEITAETADELYDTLILLNKILWGRLMRNNPPSITQIKEIVNKVTNNLSLLSDLLSSVMSTHIVGKSYFHVHSLNVMILSIYFGQALEYDRQTLAELGISALLHDIGMISVPAEIFMKHGKLNAQEMSLVKEHAKRGAEMVKGIEGINERIVEGIFYHHEREDGSGYHQRKNGEQISEFARVIALADSYEALTHPRLFRKALPPDKAMEKILSEGKDFYSDKVMKLMVNKFFFYPPGSLVQLTNGEIGRIRKVHPNFPIQPTVEIFLDNKGTIYREFKTLDLIKERNISIKKSVTENEFMEIINKDPKKEK